MTQKTEKRFAGRPDQQDVLSIALQMKLTGTYVEVGTFGGHFAADIMEYCRPKKLYCVDPYENYETFRDSLNDKGLAGVYAEARDRLASYGERVEFMRMYSAQAAGNFADDSVDVVYIDGNHSYSYVLKDFECWFPKLRDGGLICANHAIDFEDDGQRDAEGNVVRVWTRNAKGEPENWGHYGVLKAAKEYAQRSGIALYQAGTQCLIFKGRDLKTAP